MPKNRCHIRFTIDFVPDVAPFDYNVLVKLIPEGTSVRMITTVDRHHDEEWTRLASLGFESTLNKLAAALAALRRG